MDKDRILSVSFDGLEDASDDVSGLPQRIAELLSKDEKARLDAIYAVTYRLYVQAISSRHRRDGGDARRSAPHRDGHRFRDA
jgi:hypothetical protein